MGVLGIFTSMIPLAILGGIVWAVSRGVSRSSRDRTEDVATSVRRLFVHVLLFVALVLTAAGAIGLLGELIDPSASDDDTTVALARSLAFLIIGAPILVALGRVIDRRLAGAASERRSPAWMLYLDVALGTGLVATTIEAHAAIRSTLNDGPFDRRAAAAAVVWAAVWAVHWFWALQRHGVRGDLHLASGTAFALVWFGVGLSGLSYEALDVVYEAVAGDHGDRGGPTVWSWAVTAGVGAIAWAWYWLVTYQHAPRSPLWHVVVVLVGALGGVVATIVASSIAIGQALVWFLGSPGAADAAEHFTFLPTAVAVAAVGVASWRHHQLVLHRHGEPTRDDPLRADDYLRAAAGLVASVVGLVLLLVVAAELVTTGTVPGAGSLDNRTIGALTTLVIGAVVWARAWQRIEGFLRSERSAELSSPVRRVHLFTLFGVAAIAAVVAGIAALTGVLEDTLSGSIAQSTLVDNRVAIAVVLVVTGVAWFHWRTFRDERADLAAIASVAVPASRRRIVLVSPGGAELAERLAGATDTDVFHWQRTDLAADVDVDLALLTDRVAAAKGDDLLVLVDATGPTVVPIRR